MIDFYFFYFIIKKTSVGSQYPLPEKDAVEKLKV